MVEIHVPKIRQLEVKVDKDRVIVLEEGKVKLNLPWNIALPLGKAMASRARIAEEFAKAPEIIKDQALLTRIGFPFGLSNNPDIQKEALKEAQHTRELRRALPGGIKSQSIVGTPTVIKKPPPKKEETQ